jgi:hypothetical protein
MKEEDRLLGLHELMKIATNTEAIARQAWEESKADRITRRLARDPHDVGAFSHATVELAKNGISFSPEIPEEQVGWFLLQISMEEISYAIREQLWNDAQRNRCSGMRTAVDRGLSDPGSSRWVFRATVYKSPRSRGFVG